MAARGEMIAQSEAGGARASKETVRRCRGGLGVAQRRRATRVASGSAGEGPAGAGRSFANVAQRQIALWNSGHSGLLPGGAAAGGAEA